MNRRRTGAQYEEQAARWLQERGFRIEERNYRCPLGEIDLIARDDPYLVFVEVKYRSDGRSGDPSEAVDGRKRRRICRAAAFYCKERRIPEDCPCRFDVVSVLGKELRHIRNAFECEG
ncbi:MAG: YraN family protein [Eubacteriales bacterium]|nr:YraN family protein [Eubacteriales bacterium]